MRSGSRTSSGSRGITRKWSRSGIKNGGGIGSISVRISNRTSSGGSGCDGRHGSCSGT